MKEGGETTQSLPRTYVKIQINSEEITKNKQLNKRKTKPQNNVHMEEQPATQPAHTCTTEDKRWGKDRPSDNQLLGKTHQRKTQQEPKTKDIHRANINHSPRSVRSGDQGDCTLNLTDIL